MWSSSGSDRSAPSLAEFHRAGVSELPFRSAISSQNFFCVPSPHFGGLRRQSGNGSENSRPRKGPRAAAGLASVDAIADSISTSPSPAVRREDLEPENQDPSHRENPSWFRALDGRRQRHVSRQRFLVPRLRPVPSLRNFVGCFTLPISFQSMICANGILQCALHRFLRNICSTRSSTEVYWSRICPRANLPCKTKCSREPSIC